MGQAKVLKMDLQKALPGPIRALVFVLRRRKQNSRIYARSLVQSSLNPTAAVS